MKSLQNYTLLFVIILSFLPYQIIAQEWQVLNANTLGWRFEDMQFVDTEIGWVVDGGGQILKTIDGGITWSQQYYNSSKYFRSVEFYDDQIGFAGTLANGAPSTTLLRTTDGGENWIDISTNLPVAVAGICGMHMVSENIIFLTGVFYSNAYIMKSIDQGETWVYTDMGNLCNALVDVYFKDESIGFAIGQSAQSTGLKAIIVGTTDGGTTWSQSAIGEHSNQRAWKLQELNDTVMFASIEKFEPSPQYFKSIDNGLTWGMETVVTPNTSGTIQGIGFLTEDIGWVGGHGELFYETKNGGESWEYKPTIGTSFNRFQRVNDTLIYTSGVNVYKYSDPSILGISEFEIVKPKRHLISIKNSNIITDNAIIELYLINNTYCELSIYNVSGQRVQTLENKKMTAGNHEILWNASSLSTGQYFVVINTYHGFESIKVVVK